MIPEVAVEAAARVLDDIAYGADWDLLNDSQKESRRTEAKLILEAAAPFMLASVADEREGDLFRFTLAQREWLRGGAE